LFNPEGESRAWTVYEDRDAKAFLDMAVVSEGHTLVIPQEHYENIFDIPDGLLQHLIIVAKRIASSYKVSLNATAQTSYYRLAKTRAKTYSTFTCILFPGILMMILKSLRPTMKREEISMKY
jgi:diadenosine tetraphosphate (Ap4A) HIT family hydrolase